MYEGRTLYMAMERGYDPDAHLRALLDKDEDAITRTHPSNWLTEDEVEAISKCPICREPITESRPPHFASRDCESGGRPHCSCDVCF